MDNGGCCLGVTWPCGMASIRGVFSLNSKEVTNNRLLVDVWQPFVEPLLTAPYYLMFTTLSFSFELPIISSL